MPKSILNDEYYEELSFPHLFPTGKFGYKVRRKVTLSPVKYFNQRLLNYSQKFASDTDYIFFACNILQCLSLNEQINIVMRKVSGVSLNAGVLNNSCFNEAVKQWVSNDQGFRFMSSIKGTPSYWKKFKSEVLAKVKQLGVPTFFLTLSCVDLRWKEFLEIKQKLNEAEFDISNLSYHDRCNILNSNPVLVVRHFQYRVEVFFKLMNSNPVLVARQFQYRVEVFFKLIIIDGPLGKSKHYSIRVEF